MAYSRLVELPLQYEQCLAIDAAAEIAAGGVLNQLRHPVSTRPFRQIRRIIMGITVDHAELHVTHVFFPESLIPTVESLRKVS